MISKRVIPGVVGRSLETFHMFYRGSTGCGSGTLFVCMKRRRSLPSYRPKVNRTENETIESCHLFQREYLKVHIQSEIRRLKYFSSSIDSVN